MTIVDMATQPFLEFSFMRRALVGCLALSVSATPIGVFMILRRMSLFGEAMSHAILPGAAIGYLISGLSLVAMTLGGLCAGLIVVVLSGFISRNTHVKNDASLAAFYLMSLALGVLIISKRGGSIDLLHVLFGSVLALNNDALVLILSIATLSLLILSIIYRVLVLESIDPIFLQSVSKKSGAFAHYLFMPLVVLNLVGGFQALGTLMVVGIMILPSASAFFWSKNLSTIITCAVLFSISSSVVGLVISFYIDVSSGPAIILTAGSLYMVSLVLGKNGLLRNGKFRYRHAHLYKTSNQP